MRLIKISNINKYFIVDDEDFDRVKQHTWTWSDTNGANIIQTRIYDEKIHLSKFILNYAGELDIDHKNRNRFDNQKENLRFATTSQNMANQPKRVDNTSGYKGVFWHTKNKKWFAQIRVQNMSLYLGSFRDKEEAVRMYNKAAVQYFGEFAYLNKL